MPELLPDYPVPLQEKIALAKRQILAELMSEVIDTFLAEGFRLDELLEAFADYTHHHKLEPVTFHLERAALNAKECHGLTCPAFQQEKT